MDDFRTLELSKNGQRRVLRARLRQDKGHQAAWSSFLKAVRRGAQPPIPYDQLWGVTLATFAAVESLRCGEPVDIPSSQV